MILTITATTYRLEESKGEEMPESGSFEVELTDPPEIEGENWKGNLIMEGEIYAGMKTVLDDFLKHGLEIRVVEESYASYEDSYYDDRTEKITTYKVPGVPSHHRMELNHESDSGE